MANIKKSVSKAPAKKSSINNDFSAVVDQLLLSLKTEAMDDIKELMKEFKFPDHSVPFSSINLNGALLSGNTIRAGTIKQFSSTGIEDLAKETKLTILDSAVVVENKLVAQRLSVKGNVEIDGNVTILGDTGFDKETTSKLVHAAKLQVYASVSKDLTRELENLSGDNIIGGSITKFSSTGIEDLAKETKLTILDDMVVVENELVAQKLAVKGDTTIEGNLVILGEMPLDAKTRGKLIDDTAVQVHDQISEDIKTELVDSIINKIKDTQFDVKNILIRGKPLIDGENGLAPFIRNTRITQVSALKELQVLGEAQLCGSFYAGNNRVGINTVEPAAALSVWDEEVEIVIGKHSANRSYFGTLRAQEVVIGAHNKQNVILGTNGVTSVKALVSDQTRFYSGDKVPNFQGELGAVCFNTKPAIGQPYGWICLGGARWGIMGSVE